MNTNWSIFDEVVRPEDIGEAKTFSDAIYKLLQMKRYQIVDLAKDLKCTPKHVSELAHGKTSLTIKMAIKLEEVSDVPALEWFRLYLITYRKD